MPIGSEINPFSNWAFTSEGLLAMANLSGARATMASTESMSSWASCVDSGELSKLAGT